jgi:hypothetical protein
MAIANLNAGGTGGNRPPVGEFFGKSIANDNMQKVSSDFISKDVVGSVLDAIGGISAELKKIQQFSKDAIKGFERLVADMRRLNNDIASKFKAVNAQMKKDNMEFLRSITTRPSGEGLMPVSDTSASGVSAASNETKPNDKPNDKPEEKKSFLDSILDLANLADTAKDAFDLAKRYGPRIMQGARAFAGSAALPITALAGGMIALGYHRKQAQEADPVGAAVFDSKISGAGKRAEVIQGTDADKNAPNANADIGRGKKTIPQFLFDEKIIPLPSMEEVRKVVDTTKTTKDIITLKDGRFFDPKEQILKNPDGSPAGKPQVNQTINVGDGTPTPSAGPAYRLPGFKDLNESRSASSGAAIVTSGETTAAPAPTGETTQPAAATAPATETGAPIKVSDIPPSASPANVPAEGNTPAAKEAGAPTPAAAPAPAPASKFLGSPSSIDEEDFSNLANVSGVQVEKGKDLPPNALAALDAMISNDPEATARKYPAWVLDQYAKQNGKGSPAGGAGDQTNPELGGGAGGTPAAEGGTAGGGSMGGPEGEPGMPAGAPEAAPSGPPSVPADLTPPSQASQDATPVVINNESSSSSGSVTNPEGNASSGQNLPMTAQNDALTEYFAKQNIDYQ